MKTNRLMIGACIFAAVAAVGLGAKAAMADGAPAAVAQADEPGHRPLRNFINGQIGRLMTLRSEMDLTPEQRRQIKTIVQSHRKEIADVAKPLIEKHRALRDATLAPTMDEKAIRAAAEEMGKSIGDAAVLAAKIKAQVRAVLKPDQLQKLEEFRKHADQATDEFIQKMANPQ